ncbi:MAG TPA: IPT/TIG domain-containing protein [Solirubrobacteraceae bacterium]|jgi:hypothetical protein
MRTVQRIAGLPVGGRALALVTMAAALTLLVFCGSALASSAPGIESGAPMIESESVTGVTEHEATLEAEIKPESGTELTYLVEYGATTSYGTSAPAPPETIRWATCGLECEGEDERPRHVSINLAGLEARTTYHYRFIATNGRGQAEGEDATFTTDPTGNAPVITSLEPDHGPTSGGTTVTIHGEPLENARSVHFGTVEGKILHEECGGVCEIAPYRTLVVESPPHAAGTVDVTVETAQGVSVASPGDEFTYGSSGGPSIESESVSHLTPSDATLEAQVDTEGLPTLYQFRLSSICGGRGACLVVINYTLPSGLLLGSFINQSVSLDLNSAGVTLEPGGTYSYSVSATSSAGTTESSGQTLTTPEEEVEPLSPTTSTPSGSGQPAGSGGSSSSSIPSVSVLGTQTGKTPKSKALTSEQKLANGLKACEKKPASKRAVCEKQAHKKYGAMAKKSRR